MEEAEAIPAMVRAGRSDDPMGARVAVRQSGKKKGGKKWGRKKR
jgi:hypothetical protein